MNSKNGDAMIQHLNNILVDIKLLKKSSNDNEKEIIKFIENWIIEIRDQLVMEKLSSIDTNKVKKISEQIYQLNYDNTFSQLTDHISNEFYAFEFLMIEKMKDEK